MENSNNKQSSDLHQKENERRKSKRKLAILITGIAILIGTVTGLIVRAKNSKSVVGSFLVNAKENLKNTNSYTNLVLLGVGGEGHKAPDLTDSIIFVSINLETMKVITLPIPRDIWVNTMKAKVNTAYHYGNERRQGGGLDLAKSAVAEITGQPTHYAFVLNFDGFIKAIDSIGGIEVEVERTFDDYKYPIPGNEDIEPEEDRYEHLHFDKGWQEMDGETALKFSRSRYAEGDEGTDFARSARQQKIINAFLDKVFSTETLLHPSTVKEILEKLQASIDTDIQKEEYASFLKVFLDFRKSGQNIKSGTFEEFLKTPANRSLYDGQWVLAPILNWQEIHDYVVELVQK